MSAVATAPEVVSFAAWRSANFEGATITMRGTMFRADSDIKIESGLVADVHRAENGDVQMLVLNYSESKRDWTQANVCADLSAAAAKMANDRAAWNDAYLDVVAAKEADDEINGRWEAANTEGRTDLDDEWDRLGGVLHDANWRLFAVPAPDREALLWKAEHLFGEAADDERHGGPCWDQKTIANYMADVRRFAKRED